QATDISALTAPVLCDGGATSVTYNITDLCESGQDTATFTVTPATSVSFDQQNLPTDIAVECDSVPEAEILTASTSCGSVDVIYSEERTDGNCPSSYELKRTWTVNDNCGSTIAHTQIIIVSDTKAPVAPNAPANITFECIDDVPVAGNLTAVDNCAGNITVGGVDTLDNSNPCNVIITRTWTFTDDCGNTSSVVQTITVIDTTAPELTSDLDTDLTVSCSNVPEIPSLKFTDNCSSNVDVVFDETNSFDEAILDDYEIIRTWTVSDACGNKNTYTQTLHVTLDEVITEITAGDKCYDDGIVNLNDYLQTTNLTGVWEMLEGNTDATLEGNIFNPTLLELSLDFKPGTGGIDYLFKYATTDFGCVSVTYVSMNINAECTVLPCGSEDVIISKAITPNGDQWNENFEINGVELCGFVIDVKIFNRWGALVFESHNYQNDWNGKAMSGAIGNASKLPNGTYYYIIILKDSGLNPFTGPVYIGTK
ncbi:gliding motility-associated C-terminal domain-containing protein, partial [Gaetbulibacter aquiaggeris]